MSGKQAKKTRRHINKQLNKQYQQWQETFEKTFEERYKNVVNLEPIIKLTFWKRAKWWFKIFKVIILKRGENGRQKFMERGEGKG